MRSIDELRPLKAAKVLELWRQSREESEDALERTLLCNARILRSCCFYQGEAAFEDEWAVLSELTGRQMERLLRRLADEGGETAAERNPSFDEGRFYALQEG